MVWTNRMFRRACEDNLAWDSNGTKMEWQTKDAWVGRHLRMVSGHATHWYSWQKVNEWRVVITNSSVDPHCRYHHENDDDNDDLLTILTSILTFFKYKYKIGISSTLYSIYKLNQQFLIFPNFRTLAFCNVIISFLQMQ